MDPTSRRPKRNTGALSSIRLFNTDSPITKQGADIQTFLSICVLNWSQYSEEEKEGILTTLPPMYRALDFNSEESITCPISPDFVANDTIMRDQIARFKRDVSDGYYTKTWQEKAKKAMEDRADGKFDEFLTKHAEEMFTADENNEVIGEVESDGEYGSRKKDRKSYSAKRDRKQVS